MDKFMISYQKKVWKIIYYTILVITLFNFLLEVFLLKSISTLPTVIVIVIVGIFMKWWINRGWVKHLLRGVPILILFPISYLVASEFSITSIMTALVFLVVFLLLSESFLELLYPVIFLFQTYAYIAIEYFNAESSKGQELVDENLIVLSISYIMVSLLLTIIIGFAQAYIIGAQQKMIELTVTDDLTKIYNRRFLMSTIEGLADKQMNKGGIPFYVVFIDVNKFKNINDTYGHNKGDEVLRLLGGVISDTVRKTDIGGRYGGDEFMIVLPNTDYAAASMIAGRVQKRFYEQTKEMLNIPVTLAIGISSGKDKDIETLVHEADEKMYAHKIENR